MYKNILAFCLIIVIGNSLLGQITNDNQSRINRGEDLNVLYRNEESFGLFIHSATGIGLTYRRGHQLNRDVKRMFEIELSNFKHAKERRAISIYNASNSKNYIYGKVNSLLLLRAGIGYKNIIYRRSDKKNIEIRYLAFGGATIAFAKPIYLEIRYNDSISTEMYNPDLHNTGNIYGKSDFFTGFGKTKLRPALYLKTGLSFDFASRYNEVKSIETGVIMDAYPIAIEIMAFNPNRNLLFSLYLKMIWGRKWI